METEVLKKEMIEKEFAFRKIFEMYYQNKEY